MDDRETGLHYSPSLFTVARQHATAKIALTCPFEAFGALGSSGVGVKLRSVQVVCLVFRVFCHKKKRFQTLEGRF